MFGALLQNQENNSILDSDSFAYYAVGSGPAVTLFTSAVAGIDYVGTNQSRSTNIRSTSPGPYRGNNEKFFTRPAYAATGLVHRGADAPAYGGKIGWGPVDIWEKDDICFWQVGTNGIAWMGDHHYVDQTTYRTPTSGPPTVFFHWPANHIFFCGYMHDVRPNWIVARKTSTLPTTTDTYGMQLFNSNSEVTFDSRHPQIPINHVFIIPASDMEDVIVNNTTKTISLPFPIPNAYIHSPNWYSFYRENSSAGPSVVRAVNIRQVSSTAFELSRVRFPAQGGANSYDNRWGCWCGFASQAGADGPATMQGIISYYMDTPVFVSAGIVN